MVGEVGIRKVTGENHRGLSFHIAGQVLHLGHNGIHLGACVFVDQFAVGVGAVGINHILHGNKGAQQASQPGGAAGDGVQLQSSQQQHQRIHQVHRVEHQQRGVLFRQQIHHIQPQRQQH